MTEVLINLNSIIKLLKISQNVVPDCISRIADWEMFGRKVAPGFSWALMFKGIFEKLNAEKNKFGLEDDYLYILLNKIVYLDRESIDRLSAADLYQKLVDKAIELKMSAFWKAYSGSVSIGKRISHIKEELEEVFDFRVEVGNHNIKYYTFKRKIAFVPKVIEHHIEEEVEKYIPQEAKGSQPYLFDREVQIRFIRAGLMEWDEEKLLSWLLAKDKDGPLDPVEESLREKEKINNIRRRIEEAENSRFVKPN
jgi:hypothetical protein